MPVIPNNGSVFVNPWDEFLSFTKMPMTDYINLFSREPESLHPFTQTHDLKVIKNSDIIIDLYHVVKGRRVMIDEIKSDEITKTYYRVLADSFLKEMETELAERGIILDIHKKHS